MQGILKAVAAAGVDQKTFSKEVGIDRFMMSKFVNGHCNPTPPQFKKICDRAGLPPDAVATVEDVDYGVIPTTATAKRRMLDKHKKKATLRARVLPRLRKQVDKDLKVLGISSVQAWIEQCVAQLHADAERRRGHDT